MSFVFEKKKKSNVLFMYAGFSLVHIFTEYLSLPISFLDCKQNLINSTVVFSEKERHECKMYSFIWGFCRVLQYKALPIRYHRLTKRWAGFLEVLRETFSKDQCKTWHTKLY